MSYEEQRPSGFHLLPPVVKNLLIINGLLFFATYVFGVVFEVDLNDKLGLHYFGSEKFRPYQFITYMFMHGNVEHILLNMFALWMFGNTLENYWGPKRFLIYYLICGIGAALTHYCIYYFEIRPALTMINDYLANPGFEKFDQLMNAHQEMRQMFENYMRDMHQDHFSGDVQHLLRYSSDYMVKYKEAFLNASNVVGASGSIFGILLAFGMMFPNTMLYVYFAIPVKAKYFVIIYGLIELYSGFYDNTTNVAHFAHLGGMLFGLILILLWRKNHNLFM